MRRCAITNRPTAPFPPPPPEYTEAWMERMEKNGGIIPDNIGPTGERNLKVGPFIESSVVNEAFS